MLAQVSSPLVAYCGVSDSHLYLTVSFWLFRSCQEEKGVEKGKETEERQQMIRSAARDDGMEWNGLVGYGVVWRG